MCYLYTTCFTQDLELARKSSSVDLNFVKASPFHINGFFASASQVAHSSIPGARGTWTRLYFQNLTRPTPDSRGLSLFNNLETSHLLSWQSSISERWASKMMNDFQDFIYRTTLEMPNPPHLTPLGQGKYFCFFGIRVCLIRVCL